VAPRAPGVVGPRGRLPLRRLRDERLRAYPYLLAETDPVIQGYDQEEWARRFDYHGQPLDPALAVVEAVRANTVALLRRLPEAAWVREGRHTESGRYTAEDWLAIYADHLEGHARQIETNVELWQAAQRR